MKDGEWEAAGPESDKSGGLLRADNHHDDDDQFITLVQRTGEP